MQKNLFVILLLIFSYNIKADINPTGKTNPLLYGFNEVIRFNDLRGGNITEATNAVIKDADAILQQIIELENNTRTFNNTMLRIDDI